MHAFAFYRNARMAPRKIRIFREIFLGMPVREADAQLKFMPGQAPTLLRQVLKSAVANAQNNFDLAVENLKVKDIVIDGGFALKRFRPVSKGMAHPILKRTSHITVIVGDEGIDTPTKRKKRKTNIEDLTADDVVSGKVGGKAPETDITPTDDTLKKPVDVRRSQQEEAQGKMKMMQGGGDRKKTHRRKTVGD